MAIPESFIHELLARTDIVEIVGRHVQLKKGGANFMGLCPFHGEKSPSFSVSPTKQFYHCFGCGAHGDAIRFLMEHTGVGFRDAVQDLAGQYGLEVPDDDPLSPEQKAQAAARRERQATLTDVLEKAGDAYRQRLRESPRAVDYLKGRGVSGAIAKRFGLGYAPEGWRTLAGVFPDYADALLVDSGLVIASDEGGEGKRYDRFRDRIMFPIRNVKGECIGFGGRVLGDEKPKYLNSPETPVFSKGRELYGLFEARTALREQGYALVTEGYMDVVALAQLGFANAVATLGTACTDEHVHKLFRFTDAVVFSFDGDAAGRRAARKALEAALPHATDVRSVKFLFLPAEHDPDSFIRANGTDAFGQAVAQAVPLSRFLLEAAREGCELGSAEGRARMASQARPLWQALPDGALRQQLLAEIAQAAHLEPAGLQALWAGQAPAPAPGAPRGDFRDARDGADARDYADEPPPGWDDGGGHAPYTPPAARGGAKGQGKWKRPFGAAAPRPPAGPRPKPASRADHAARLMLERLAAWEHLSGEEHALLCGLPAPHGPLFAWLERCLHEYGPLEWPQLRADMAGQPFEDLAVRLMAGPPGSATEAEWDAELRDLLDRMLIEHLKAQETEAIAAAGRDPQALARYRELLTRRLALEKKQRG
ncbi:DNA primase [Pseudacidovorax intermedius]|uniref:DNA primase n=1 Tax=Pseudacidovorax intermedius TaxID=433924 RepID=A0A147GNF8_9BURK|nr:DNA primase [Pseudacidovorax intermedius]KTT15256.1 DNA primase [Pseudacidovorax intermedius]